jgi:hypothetical protein
LLGRASVHTGGPLSGRKICDCGFIGGPPVGRNLLRNRRGRADAGRRYGASIDLIDDGENTAPRSLT